MSTALRSLAVLAAPAVSLCGTTTNEGAPLPCDVDNALRAKCQACHGTLPKWGAPMSLVSYDDTQRAAVSDPSAAVWQKMAERIASPTSPMPPKGQAPLSDAERAALESWFARSAPAGDGECTSLVPPGDVGNLSGPEYLPCAPNASLRAHAFGTTAKFNVPANYQNTYVCYTFRNPFPPGQQGTAWAPLIDNDRIVHHWILYGVGLGVDGDVVAGTGCYAASLFGTMVGGWAPGAQNAILPDDVSQVMDFPFYTLQIHYSNNTGSAQPDGSGVAFCTGAPRQNQAGVVTLGTTNITINPGVVNQPFSGDCNNLSADNRTPITIVSTFPHMHKLGQGFRTEHLGHPDLSTIPVGKWDFDAQTRYPLSPRRTVLPGEKLRTTCWYSNPNSYPVLFGPATSDEMCYDFVTAYPYAAAVRKCGPAF